MATSAEMLLAGVFLLVNTVVIGLFDLIGGPLFGNLYTFLSNANVPASSGISPSILQWIPGFFFMSLIILEIILILRIAFVVISKTNYQGEQEW
jgi:uncharacterized membrane protein